MGVYHKATTQGYRCEAVEMRLPEKVEVAPKEIIGRQECNTQVVYHGLIVYTFRLSI